MEQIEQYGLLITAVVVVIILVLTYHMGKTAGKKSNSVCLTTEDEVFRVAEAQINQYIDTNFFRSDVSDEAFADEIAEIRRRWRPFILDIQKSRIKNNKNV